MEKIWLESYPQGVPETINPDAFESIDALLTKAVGDFPNHCAFSNMGATLSYTELQEKALHFAAYLQQDLKLRKGDRIAFMMPNVLQYPVMIFGALKAGLTVVNVNPLYTERELTVLLKDSGATTLVVLENFAHVVEQSLRHVALENIIITKMGDELGTLKGGLVNFAVRFVKKMVPTYQLDGVISFKKAMNKGAKLSFNKVPLMGSDVAFLQYTGGTTGAPKAAELTHRNMVANVLQCTSWVKTAFKQDAEVVLGALPLYHIFSLTVCCMCFLSLGACCELITNPRDINGLVKTLLKRPPNVYVGVNTLFNALAHHPGLKQVDFSNLRFSIGGGMAVQRAISELWQKITGKPILEGYGLTEASPVISINPLTLDYFNESAGLPVPGTDIQVRDPEGNVLAQGKEGELWVKGPQVMKGYWNNSNETANVLDADGWLRTGDIVRMDERGFIYIVDRLKDMILVSGFNVYPNEIENVLAEHPGVKEVAVIGIPDEHSGEAIKAFIVKENGTLSEEELLTHCRKQLTGYKLPKHIEFREELPKTNVGKVLRRELRDS